MGETSEKGEKSGTGWRGEMKPGCPLFGAREAEKT